MYDEDKDTEAKTQDTLHAVLREHTVQAESSKEQSPVSTQR